MKALRLASLSMTLLAPAATAAEKTGTLAFADDATVRLDAGATKGTTKVHLKAEGLKAEEGKTLACVAEKPADVGGSGPAGSMVEFGVPVAAERGATTCLWLVPAAITGVPPHSSQKRFARVKADGLEQIIGYTLSNLAPASFTWTVAPASTPWLVWHGPPADRTLLPIVVTTTDGAATGLRLAQGGLRDNPIVNEIALTDLELCPSESGCGAIGTIPPRSVRTLFLRVKPTRRWVHGKYSGSVSLAVNERTEPQAVTLNLHASSAVAWLLGVGLIAAGTWLGWWTNVWARGRVLRLEALQALDALRIPIARLADAVRAAPPGYEPARIRDAVKDAESSVSIAELDRRGLLPPLVPSAYGSADRAAELQAHLQAVVARIDGLSHVVRQGLEELWPYLEDEGPPPEAAIKALRDLDARGANVDTEAAAITLVDEVLAQFKKDAGIEADVERAVRPEAEKQTLAAQLGGIHTKVWLAWGLVTVLTGSAALIVSNPGFGTATDLLLCFLWGVGLPAAVDKLQKMNPTGVGSHLNLTLPKAPASGGEP